MMNLFTNKVALLWDESFLWGVMAVRALRAAGLPFALLRAEDIRAGRLDGHTMLFVPGGWASNKAKALGEEGAEAIRRFVHEGGSYLGICGGAGLATQDGIGLLEVKRRPTKERVPSFSGRIHLNITDHPLWKGLNERGDESLIFHAWWPSQFIVEDSSIKVLATYGAALPDAFSSDLNAGDVEAIGAWSGLEERYGINLDPGRLLNDPAVIQGSYGKGTVVLSLIHFDTPDDDNGRRVLINLWSCLGHTEAQQPSELPSLRTSALPYHDASALMSEMEEAVDELIALGLRNFLWFWRNPLLLQWRRGVRGLEYNTLFILIKEIGMLMRRAENGATSSPIIAEKMRGTETLLVPFIKQAQRLLLLERQALQNGRITYEKCDDPEIREIRMHLFSSAKSYGGAFKKLIDETDRLLYALLVPGSIP
ncbi:MAG: BPL-N domain-containing protein [Nitrospirota bacterium]